MTTCSSASARRAVITGLGVVAPGGVGTKAFWEMLTAGRTATRPITLFDASPYRCRIAAEVDFDPEREGLSPKEIRRMDRAGQFALVATREALADGGLDGDGAAGLDRSRAGVSLGSAIGSSTRMEEEYVAISDGGRDWLVDHRFAAPYSYSYIAVSSLVTEVAWAARTEGPAVVVSAGCTSGLDAVGHAVQLIEDGTADVMIAGSTDAPLTPITMACFDALKATTPRNDDPAAGCRPFHRDRDGIVLGEGAAMFVVEEYEHARRRGARIRAEVLGYANRANAYHMTGLRPDGAELAEAIRAALGQARLDPSDIRYVNAHGSGTRQNDLHETAAVKRALGAHAYDVPMSSIKSMVGHSLGAIGAIEIAACVLAIEDGIVPPTANLTVQDPDCDLDYVPLVARTQDIGAVLTVGSGFGGFQTAMVLSEAGRAA
ncbi:beta-ketoacyl-[acyl-carrier-protein] synthase family protein [Actinomadura rubrisoli]|uniref:Beta-ketoacyl-[acyl-carrier-protein] synthase family protein n=1 Tax=Actinomadura rubrisoli TaxID=2530368 RepID=A0A4R5ALI2_9ACTN|nr:beta-ketoacyl-[acyl-carrier-protein] synthase family protein [Actinomadura rubrisoli]TDD73463.1 beta-ketoacyl-[acyl-carrier-protein] synthase family protein [Actinomadura rubrisoli]